MALKNVTNAKGEVGYQWDDNKPCFGEDAFSRALGGESLKKATKKVAAKKKPAAKKAAKKAK